ncbi:internal virion protein D / murein transglycosylase [Pseudomonas phage PlaquesPlease]|uniref:Internal virion protein D / murein transglycosylase n=1 Tax=Pseudomonas phage PlaquesPlease TaxID=2762289 RepID=A0A7G8LJV5_9CAUD|nr:internal virion protein D / murein transglycosylase [Pseudomonas phage PlaquesPlease]
MNRKDEYAKVLANGSPYDDMIRQAADANGVPYEYLHKKIFNESSFNPNAKSPTGPRGLGQFTAATGKAYGLVTDEDFFDPVKSINAAAQHTRDLMGTYKGDLLKVALAYNQGNGRLGAPQLAALDRGDFSKISPEGQQYMANLLDVAGDSPSRRWFSENPNAPKPVSDFNEATAGVRHQPKGVPVAPQPQSFDLALGEAPKVQPTFREMELEQNGPDKGAWDNTWDAVKSSLLTSVPAQIARNITIEDHDPLDWVKPNDTSNWTDEDFENIRKEGVDPQYFGFIFDYTRGSRDKLPEAIALAKENADYDRRIGKAGWAGQLTAGIAGAALDPLTYVPVPGGAGASFAARVGKQAAFSSAMSVGSEALREQATGIEGHYAAAAVGGAVVGGAAAAALDKFIAKAATGPARQDMPDADLEAVLARHGEAGLPNREVDLPEGMEPTPKVAREDEQDDDYLEKILGLHGERHTRQEGLKDLPDDSVEAILAKHQESSEPNEFYGPTSRLQAREAARQAGVDDPTRMPINSDDMVEDFGGVAYADYPAERGAVRLRDGSIMSGANPLNPKTLKLAAELGPDRSARGFSLGAITEIGYKLNRSNDPEVLSIGSQLFRSTVQTESGSNGRFAATASDIIERLRGEDHLSYGKLNDLTENLLKNDPKYAGMEGSRLALMERAYRRVAEAIEDSLGAKKAMLSKQERELMDHINSHFQRKQDVLENPAQFGNAQATAVLDQTRHAGHYVPNVYDDAARALHLQKFGGADGLQQAIKASWLASYASRAAVKARVDKFIKEAIEAEGKVATPELMKARVERYAHDKAYGISHTQDFNRSTLIDDGLDSLVGAENNNFLEARNLFDSDVGVPMSDGTSFAVNDLRMFDFTKLMPSYDRRINGDVGIMGATGEGTDALKARILKLKTSQGNNDEIEALESAVKLLTGRARRDPDDAFGTALRSLNDLSFFTKNAYMGAQNFTEIAGMVTNGHLRMLMHGVPYLREMTTWGTKIKPKQLREMHDLIFGRELDDSIRPRRADIVDRLRAQGSNSFVAQTVGSIKYGTQELAARSPLTKFLTETSNYIMDAGRQGALMDMIRSAHGETPRILTDKELHRLSITKQQFEGIKKAIKEHIVPDGQGFKIKDPAALRSDPRTMDMWRLGDKIADESILRPHKLSSQDSRALGAGWHMALQFKKFVFRSLNGRLMRGIYDSTKNGRAIDFAIQGVVATGLATGFFVAQRYVQAQGMPVEQRKDFLKNSFTPEMLAWAAASRNNILGSPIGVANFFLAPLGYDPAAAVRTSVLPRGPEFVAKDRPVRYSPLRSDGVQQPLSRLLEQVPGAGIVGSVYQVGANAEGLWKDTRRQQELGYMTGLYNGLRGLVPNDPVSQRALSAMMQEAGMEYRTR